MAEIKEISFDSKERFLKGGDLICRAVSVTLGPSGSTVAIEQSFGPPKTTKDGVTVAKAIASGRLADPVMTLGAKCVSEAASKAGDEAGDGTTTATVLTYEFMKRGAKMAAAGAKPFELKRGIDKGVLAAVEALKKLSKECNTDLEIEQVGTISSNGDKEIGKLLSEAMKKVGKDGVITIGESQSFNDELETVDGMSFDRGYISPYFVTNQQNMSAELDNPYILLVDKKISNIREMLPILEGVAKASRPLLIIAEDVEGEALATLVVNNIRGVVKAVAVKAPGFGDRRKSMLQDIGILTGSQVISEELGLTLENASVNDLGSAKRVVITKDATTIIDGSGKSDAVQERVSQLRKQLEDTTSEYDREKIQERIAKLAGGVAVIKVSALTEIEMKEKKARVEDALNATRAAVEEGIVPGGGVALIRAVKALEGLRGDNEDQNIGIDIVRHALEAPIRKIVENSGGEPAVVLEKIREKDGAFGYNAATGEFGDMMKMGIIDPTKVTRTALQTAASVASVMITTDCIIVDQPSKDDHAAGGDMGGMGGMGGMGMM